MGRITYEIDGSHGTVGLYLPDHPADATFSEGIARMAIEAQQQQPAVRGGIETHTLMHHIAGVAFRRCYALGRFICRESHDRPVPCATVFRCRQQRHSRRFMFVSGTGEVFKIKLSVPISQVGRVVIGKASTFGPFRMRPIGSEHLYILGSYGITEASFMKSRITNLATHIGYGF